MIQALIYCLENCKQVKYILGLTLKYVHYLIWSMCRFEFNEYALLSTHKGMLYFKFPFV